MACLAAAGGLVTRFNAVSCSLIAAIFFLSVSVAAVRGGHTGYKVTAAGVPGRSPVAVGVRVVEVSPRSVTTRRSSSPSRNHPHPITTRLLDTTAYCATGNRTASGVWPQIGMAASNLFRFGQRLRVPGIGVVTVTDRVGFGSELDLYMGDAGCEQRALTFGRRSLLVEVLP